MAHVLSCFLTRGVFLGEGSNACVLPWSLCSLNPPWGIGSKEGFLEEEVCI